MKRNEKANCGNCPYFIKGYCWRYPPQEGDQKIADDSVCGEHPDFAAPEPSDMPAPMAERVELIDALEKANAELVALRHETRDCASFPSRKAVRAELRAKVEGLDRWEGAMVWRDDVLALLEDKS